MIGTEQERTAAVDWVEQKMQYLTTIPGDRSRADASLIYTALIELVSGVEPHSVTGQRGRAQWLVAPKVKERLQRIRKLKARLRRAPRTGRRKKWEEIRLDEHLAYLGLSPRDADEDQPSRQARAEKAWELLSHASELTDDESRALYLRVGQELPAREVATLMKLRAGRVHRLCHTGMRKVEAWIVSRAWTLNTFMR